MKERRKLVAGLMTIKDDAGSGMGFMCQVGPQLSIITAAHCLQRMPDPTRTHYDPVFVAVQPFDGPQRQATALVRFVDPYTDIAILGNANWQCNLYDHSLQAEESYEMLTVENEALLVDTQPKVSKECRVHICTCDQKWVSGIAHIADSCHPFAYLKMTSRIPPGTSGAPVFDDNGKVLGVLSLTFDGGYRMAVIAYALPVWAVKHIGMVR